MKKQQFRHVLCVYPYQSELSALGVLTGYPPLGLELIAAVIEPFCQDLDIIDFRREKEGLNRFLKPETDLVCLSINWKLEEAFIAKVIASVPKEIQLWVGGRHATEDPEKWLGSFPNIDILVRGDGEDVVELLVEGVPLPEIRGLSFRNGENICHNDNHVNNAIREDLFPNRTKRRYQWTTGLESFGVHKTFDTIVTSRGCPFNCQFCSFNKNPWGTKRSWTPRSPESVVAEVEETEADFIAFVDDLFTHDMNRVERICDLLLEKGIRKNYSIAARLDIARRPDVLAKMRKAGFTLLLLGIESAQDKTLRSMKKGFSTQKAIESMAVIRRYGMILHGFFLIGAIGESEKEMLAIAPFAKKLGIDNIQTCILRNAPYSGLDELVRQSPGYHITPDGLVYSDHCSAEDLERICETIHKEFYSFKTVCRLIWKGFRTRMLTPRSIWQLPLTLLRQPWLTENREGYYDASGSPATSVKSSM